LISWRSRMTLLTGEIVTRWLGCPQRLVRILLYIYHKWRNTLSHWLLAEPLSLFFY